MNITIFNRLFTGFFTIIILAMTVSIYSIFQLNQLENLTKSILTIDNQLLGYEQKMSDNLLTMMRYERKFIIMKDEGLLNSYLAAERTFDKELKQSLSLAVSDETRDILERIKNQYHRYQSLFDTEIKFIQSGQQYATDDFEQKKEYEIDGMMESFKNLRSHSQKSAYNKLIKVGEADVNASQVAIIIGAISLIFGVIISIFITITITRPLSVIKKKTRDIAEGNFGDDLHLSSPPEINALVQNFNLMCSKLKEIDTLKTDFFSTMSHELRTPLTTIKEGVNLFMEGMGEGEPKKNQKRLLTIINEECSRLINLVNSLLDVSKMEAGMMTYHFTKADILSLVDKVTREIEPLARAKQITIIKGSKRTVPQVKIDCDRILHVLRNLIGNALKFTPEGGRVTITSQADEKELKTSVTDTGSGIKEENHTAIFNKYHQVRGRSKGTGLGLFIVKHIIDAHGGKVWVEQSSQEGTTMSFTLPL